MEELSSPSTYLYSDSKYLQLVHENYPKTHPASWLLKPYTWIPSMSPLPLRPSSALRLPRLGETRLAGAGEMDGPGALLRGSFGARGKQRKPAVFHWFQREKTAKRHRNSDMKKNFHVDLTRRMMNYLCLPRGAMKHVWPSALWNCLMPRLNLSQPCPVRGDAVTRFRDTFITQQDWDTG